MSLHSCVSEASLSGNFTDVNGVKFTATMTATGSGKSPCKSQNNSQVNIEKTLKNFLNTYSPKIVEYTYTIDYKNTCDGVVVDSLCYNKNDKFKIEMFAYRTVYSYTATTPDLTSDALSANIQNSAKAYRDIDCKYKVAYGIHNHIGYADLKGTEIDILNPSYSFNNNFTGYVSCHITNLRTKQKIETEIMPNLVQGYGGSDLDLSDFSHSSTYANYTTIGSIIKPNGFNLTTVDGLVGISTSQYIRDLNGLPEYEVIGTVITN